MATFDELPKAYDASRVEDGIYRAWEESGAFNPDQLPERNQAGAPYCIVMPPPNRTGTLHMGHATMLAIQDLLVRFHRMKGDRTLWIPGTDHAAIATQVKVEQLLIKQGMKDPRKELGREKFLEKVIEFAEESKNIINNQVRKMGSSCDWTRERYTFDEPRNKAVNEVFKMMYEDKIIERGYRIVNWDPQFQTTLSDDEVETKEVTAKLITFTYDKDFPIAISTTRPETKFGDTAVAVHPDDARYKKYVGKTFTPTFCGKQLSITVIADKAVEPEFGTGALGVTPAHSMVDAEIAERHNLTTIPVIGPDGRMLPEAGADFAGLTIIEARKKVQEMLNASGLLQKTEDVQQNLPIAQRGGAPVEHLPMKQWFVRVNKPFTSCHTGKKTTLKELMIEAVKSKQINIVPERFEKTYFHWIDNLRDWCISRQIWFGHQIPVWYRGGEASSLKLEAGAETLATSYQLPASSEEVICSAESPGEGWTQDPDTLDTWFSSGLWTFSSLGWPNKKEWEEHRDYHPTAVLETGYDILFFWVARMILMSEYVLGEVPFKDVYLHGLVRDEQGRKMSKSLGNVIDPLDVIPKYGTDAVRLSLIMGTTPGQDVKLSEAKIEGFRNFTNKLWNISRFILTVIPSEAEGSLSIKSDSSTASAADSARNDNNPFSESHSPEPKTLADEWILSRLTEVAQSVTHKIEHYEFSSAGEELRDFTWGDLADWYLEIAKIEKGKEAILSHILKTILSLWHPFMPFVTEEIWKTAGFGGELIVGEWPEFKISYEANDANLVAFNQLMRLVTLIRQIRSMEKVEANVMIECAVMGDASIRKILEENVEIVKKLVRAENIQIVSEMPAGWHTVADFVTVAVNLGGTVDAEKERPKLEKEIAETETYLASQNAKLANEEFTSKAPAKVIETMKAKRDEAEAKLKALKERLDGLG